MGNELQVMGLNIAICDDEKVIREQIKELAEKEMPCVCDGLYETGDALLAAGKQFDIVFLDIQMEGTDGIETAKRLRQRDEDTILIFITGIREYVFEAFDVAAFHYLLKPIEVDKFREVFRRAGRELEKRKSKRRETVFIKTRNRSFSLEKDSILYIESRGKKVEIHTTGETIAFVLLGAVVFSFRIYQDMAALQEERAEKIVLENQITQMQSSMVEMEHLYDGIRSVKHDMKNHMAVLQNLLRKKGADEDEEIRQYFEGMRQSVEQIDSRVHTGNAVSDAVVGSKFRYAAKKVKGIRLDASRFMLTDAVTIKAYDMGVILNNGLDNAIEACIRMREKQPDAEAHITIRSFKAKNMYFIEIENSFDGVALFHKESGLPISTKKDKEVHGIGLKNIRKCAVKYGGDLDCIVKGSKFTLSVMVKS